MFSDFVVLLQKISLVYEDGVTKENHQTGGSLWLPHPHTPKIFSRLVVLFGYPILIHQRYFPDWWFSLVTPSSYTNDIFQTGGSLWLPHPHTPKIFSRLVVLFGYPILIHQRYFPDWWFSLVTPSSYTKDIFQTGGSLWLPHPHTPKIFSRLMVLFGYPILIHQ